MITYSDFKINEIITWNKRQYRILNKYKDLEYGLIQYDLEEIK